MCGIFAYYSNKSKCKDKCTQDQARPETLKHRGPDDTRKVDIDAGNGNGDSVHLEFHRLMINGMSEQGAQPFQKDNVYLLANGEIYNHIELEVDMAIERKPSDNRSDCEIILNLYLAYGIEETINRLDGEFAFCIVDMRNRTICVGRDHVGVRALYYLKAPGVFAVSSELKALPMTNYEAGCSMPVDQFPNRRYGVYSMDTEEFVIKPYRTLFNEPPGFDKDHLNLSVLCIQTNALLRQAVKKRLMCDRKTSDGMPAIGAFLSGGFDSSIIAALAQNMLDGPIHTFSIGFQDAPDLIAARNVAAYIGSIHHEYVVTKEYMLSLIPEVIRQIESYDITSVRASTFMYALSKYIRETTPEIVVLLSGEGPDEASGSYMYFHNSPSYEAFQAETIRLLDDLRYYDCLRGDKATARWSLEIRVPFLDQEFLHFYMLEVHPKYKLMEGIEKYILRKSFDGWLNKSEKPILPEEIIWRPKEAMSDGVSQHGLSWFQIIQKHIADKKHVTEFANPFNGIVLPAPIVLEREWYNEIFNYYYPGCTHLVPYYWLPRWSYKADGTPVEDPSARVLSVYRGGPPS